MFIGIKHLDAHQRLLVSLGMAGITALILFGFLDWATLVVAVWLAYTLASLVLSWAVLLTAHPRNFRSLSRAQDMSRTLSFLFIILAAFASLGAIILLFNTGTTGKGADRTLHIVLSVLVVVSSWLLVHTVFTLRYAHLFYDKRAEKMQNGGQRVAGERVSGGLDFPDDDAPDYLDFAYFSFIIGMTSQTADISIGSKHMRRLALIHGVLSFFFNTSIIAVSINTLSNVLQAGN